MPLLLGFGLYRWLYVYHQTRRSGGRRQRGSGDRNPRFVMSALLSTTIFPVELKVGSVSSAIIAATIITITAIGDAYVASRLVHEGPAVPAQGLLFRARTPLIPTAADVACTPYRASANLAFGGSGDADSSNSCPKRSASVGNGHCHAVRLVNWGGRHSLR